MKRTKLDAESILRKLAEIRRAIPYLPAEPLRPASDGRAPDVDGMLASTEEDFEYAALADGLTSLADDLTVALERARRVANEKALEIYYAAEELAGDPKHAALIPHVERMRAAYESEYGRPVPPKEV